MLRQSATTSKTGLQKTVSIVGMMVSGPRNHGFLFTRMSVSEMLDTGVTEPGILKCVFESSTAAESNDFIIADHNYALASHLFRLK